MIPQHDVRGTWSYMTPLSNETWCYIHDAPFGSLGVFLNDIAAPQIMIHDVQQAMIQHDVFSNVWVEVEARMSDGIVCISATVLEPQLKVVLMHTRRRTTWGMGG